MKVNRCTSNSQLIFHQQLTPLKLVLFECRLVYWLVYQPTFLSTCWSIHRPTYRMSVDQHIYRHVNRQSTDMVINTWLTRWPIVPTSTQPRGAQITQDLLFQGQFTCWNFTLKSLQLVGGDVNKPTMQNTFRRSEQLHTCQKPCQKRNRLLPSL